MKNITFVNRLANYTRSGKYNRSALVSSLEHSMRIGEALVHNSNHVPERQHLNKYFLVEGESAKAVASHECLSSILDHVNEIAPDANKMQVVNLDSIHRELSKIRYKFTAYKTKSEEEELFWQNISDASEVEKLNVFRENFKTFDVQRKNQKMKQIDKFIELHNELKKCPRQFKKGSNLKTIMQEQIFTIPALNGLKDEDISMNDYAKFILAFNKKVDPTIQVKAVVMHADEGKANDEKSGNTGIHGHVFVSGLCSDGQKMMLKRQMDFAQETCKKHSPEMHKWITDDYNRQKEILHKKLLKDLQNNSENEDYLNKRFQVRCSKLDGQVHGRLWQESFKHYANCWLNKRDLNVVFHYGTRENIEMVQDSKLPIAQRRANGQNYKLEIQNKKKLEENSQLELEKIKIESEITSLVNQKNSISESISNTQIEHFELKVKNSALKEALDKIMQMFDEFIQNKLKKDSSYDSDMEINNFATKLNTTLDEINAFTSSKENQAIAANITKMAKQADPKLERTLSKVIQEKIKY